ncbi:hypothetical protein [Kitasatospora camelliae]|uniref:Uncharacterized protein n=1 Tax=Kitasatospora camelliae TaxID=3156397 RepID=A0AAU8K2I9_9ACTN
MPRVDLPVAESLFQRRIAWADVVVAQNPDPMPRPRYHWQVTYLCPACDAKESDFGPGREIPEDGLPDTSHTEFGPLLRALIARHHCPETSTPAETQR